MKKLFAVLLVFVSFSAVHACRNPDFVFSIMFVWDDIPIDFSIFEEIGEEGVNYYYNRSNENIVMTVFNESYTYRNHYNTNVLINIGAKGINFIADTSEVDLNTLRADSCVYKELEWLNETGIVQITRTERESIAEAFENVFMAMIYWTKWDTLVASDMELNYDTTDCSIIGWCPVDCMAQIQQIIFPPQELGSTSIIHKNRFQSHMPQNINGDRKNCNAYLIDGRIIKRNNSFNLKNRHSGVIIDYNRENGIVKRSVNIH